MLCRGSVDAGWPSAAHRPPAGRSPSVGVGPKALGLPSEAFAQAGRRAGNHKGCPLMSLRRGAFPVPARVGPLHAALLPEIPKDAPLPALMRWC